MSEVIKSVVEWRKVGKSLPLVVALMTGLVLFLPDKLIREAGLGEVKDQIRPYIGLAFFISIAVFIASLVESLISLLGVEIKDWFHQRRWSKTLCYLTPDEKDVLRRFVVDGKAAISTTLSDPVVSTLVAKRIMVRTSNMGSPGSMNFPFTLQPWARQCLIRNPSLLDSPR